MQAIIIHTLGVWQGGNYANAAAKNPASNRQMWGIGEVVRAVVIGHCHSCRHEVKEMQQVITASEEVAG